MKRSEVGAIGTYRCPVCGHGDSVEVDDVAAAIIECSYCGSLLEVSGHDRNAGRLNVRLADVPIGG